MIIACLHCNYIATLQARAACLLLQSADLLLPIFTSLFFYFFLPLLPPFHLSFPYLFSCSLLFSFQCLLFLDIFFFLPLILYISSSIIFFWCPFSSPYSVGLLLLALFLILLATYQSVRALISLNMLVF